MTVVEVRVFRKSGVLVPKKMSQGAAGFDLSAATESAITLEPSVPVVIGSGVHIALPEGYEAQVRPRSSMNKAGILIGFGTVDSDYRGEIGITAINLTKVPYVVQPGDRLAQLVFSRVSEVSCITAETLEDLGQTDRGQGGFGSTGR